MHVITGVTQATVQPLPHICALSPKQKTIRIQTNEVEGLVVKKSSKKHQDTRKSKDSKTDK